MAAKEMPMKWPGLACVIMVLFVGKGVAEDMPADFLKVESKAWTRWLDAPVHTNWTRVPLKDVLADQFGPAALNIEPREKLSTPITMQAAKLSRRTTLWRLSQEHGFIVRWAQRDEPRMFMGLLETERRDVPVNGVVVTTVTEVMRSDAETYEQWKKAGRIKEEEVLDGVRYFAVRVGRDLRFDHSSAWVHILERYKMESAGPATRPVGLVGLR